MDTEKGFLIGLIFLLGFVGWLMVKPFLAYLMMAPILAFVVMPLHRKLEPKVGERISAGALVTLLLVAAIVPIVLASAAVVSDARDLASDVNSSQMVETAEIERKFSELTGREIDIDSSVEDALRSFTATAFGNFSRLVNLLTNLLVGTVLMLFVTFYLIKDGRRVVNWIDGVMPMREELRYEIKERTRITSWAVIKGHVFVAFAQGLLAGLGLAVAGVPNPVFWTFIMILLGFIPIIGTMLIWMPAALYLIMTGQVAPGVFLLLYGFTVVSLSDNVLRPLFVDREAEVHPASIIVGVIGGVYVFGPSGLFIGPIIFAALKSSLTVFRDHYEEL